MYYQKNPEKIILTDCDGVLLDWLPSFDEWISYHYGYKVVDHTVYNMSGRYGIHYETSRILVAEFNRSAAIGNLSPFRDSIKYVTKLFREHGFLFTVITSQTKCKYAQKLRIDNLKRYYGECFSDFIFLDCGADKDEILYEYKDSECYWIEDKAANAICGSKLGLNSILVKHTYNYDEQNDIYSCETWKEIYKRITNG